MAVLHLVLDAAADRAEQEPQFQLPPGEAFIRKENKGAGLL